MDKNYNVDDILSEIKRRKSQERSATGEVGTPRQPAASRPAPHPDRSGTGAPVDREAASDPPPRRMAPSRAPAEDTGDGGFHFRMPNEAPAETRRSNPMEFGGHVRPLTDRARQRGNRLSGVPGAQGTPAVPGTPVVPGAHYPPRPEYQPGPGEEEPGHTAQIDFSAFQDMRGDGGEDPQAGRQPTRVLPRFSTGQEYRTEDIRRMDFASLNSGEYGEYDEYDDGMRDLKPGAVIDYSEYNSRSDRRDVALDIARVKIWMFLRGGLTLILAVILFVLTAAGRYISIPLPPAITPELDMRMYMLSLTILTALVALVNSSTVGGGLASLFRMRANSDTLASLALLAAVGQGVIGVAKPDQVVPSALNFYFPVAALAMLFNALGKLSMINRIQTNFRLIASQKSKKAVLAVESDAFVHEFVKESTRYRPTLAYSAKADFFTDFLGLSYSDKYDVGINRSVAPICFLCAFVVGCVVFLLSRSMLSAVSSLTAVLCVCATLSATFIENIPLGKLTKRLAPQGGMVSGNKAVEDFCDTQALILTETDLFPKGNVSLHGIKAFAQGRIDEAILDAASIVCALDGALSTVFLGMIGGDKKLLRKVENIVYENGMGVSAWVGSHRVLLGNRQLMINHGVALPTDSYEQNPGAVEGEPLYLANSGEVSARFIVRYRIDEELAEELDHMALRDSQLIIYTNDANITDHMVWNLYGYPKELITVMPARLHQEFKEMSAPRENAVAEIVYTGRACAMVRAVNACVTARASILTATIIQLAQMLLGYGIVVFLATVNAIGTLDIWQLCLYQLFWFVAIFVVQKVRQS